LNDVTVLESVPTITEYTPAESSQSDPTNAPEDAAYTSMHPPVTGAPRAVLGEAVIVPPNASVAVVVFPAVTANGVAVAWVAPPTKSQVYPVPEHPTVGFAVSAMHKA
jgi:hypothetical protein